MHCIAYKKNLTAFLQHALTDKSTWFTLSFSKGVSDLSAPLGDTWILSDMADSKRKVSNVFFVFFFFPNGYYLSVIDSSHLKGFSEYILY